MEKNVPQKQQYTLAHGEKIAHVAKPTTYTGNVQKRENV